MKSYRRHFSVVLRGLGPRLHFAAHSHHPWPDVSLVAQQRAWLDAAAALDDKWERIFAEVMPAAQRHVARLLGVPDAGAVCFAPNTHELVMRVLSGLEHQPMRVLTTDGEFHSFGRQLARLEEAGRAVAVRVAVEPFDSFLSRWREAARAPCDLVYLSQVFFNSGLRVADLGATIAGVAAETIVIIDGYHGFMAVPTDLSALWQRAFYVAGGYKYAMSGEGVCFMVCPPGIVPRPVDTGWYAGFAALSAAQRGVPFAQDGSRFLGATIDPTPLYRFNAVMDWLVDLGVTVTEIQARAAALQQQLLRALGTRAGLELLPPPELPRGNFLCFRSSSARAIHERLAARGVIADRRDDRLRLGFGLYHDPADVDRLAAQLSEALP